MKTLTYASVCDGIGAVHVAWQPLGYRCTWTSEIEQFPAAVVEHHWHLPNLGDMTRITEADIERYDPIDLLVGGTPCQSFSVAGLRKGLDDPRGNLALRFLRLAGATRSRWLVWENVPGVLSSGGGRDFGTFLGALVELGYGFAYRVLDAQYFGVPQRRRRVFVVGHLGDWRRAAAVLFERACLSRNSPPPRPSVSPKAWLHGIGRPSSCLDASYGSKWGSNQWYARGHTVLRDSKPSRMTPREEERCFGFPDDYTLIEYRGKPAADGPRYRALGNSMAVPMMAWIGRRILEVEQLHDRPASD